MRVLEVTQAIADTKTLYGLAAKTCTQDEKMASKFLYEMYDQLRKHPRKFEILFGTKVFTSIIKHCENDRKPN